MTCACRSVTGFGLQYGTQAEINAQNAGTYNPAWKPWDDLYNTAVQAFTSPLSFTVTITPSAAKFFWQYMIEPHCLAFYQYSYKAGNAPVVALFQFLNNLAIKYGNVFNLSPLQLSTPGAYLYAVANGKLQLTQAGAAKIIVDCEANGVTPQSWWMTFGKPLTIMAAAVIGGEFLGASGAGAGTGGASGALAATPVPAVGSIVPAASVSAGGLAPVSSAGLTALGGVGAAGAGGAGSGILGTLSTVAGAGGTVLKTAGALQQLGALSKSPGGVTPVQPVSATTGQKPSSSVLWLVLAAAGAGTLLFFMR